MDNVQKSISVSKREEERERSSRPAAVGVNIADFPIAPLVEDTAFLKNSTVRHELSAKVDGAADRYLEIRYGDIVPNCHTEDFLIILSSIASRSEDPLAFKASFYKIHQIRGARSKINKQTIDQYVRHLDALRHTSERTNFIKDTKSGRWKTVDTQVLAGYSYFDEDGYVRKTPILEWVEGNLVKTGEVSNQRVKELDEINFSNLFWKHFLADTFSIDLAIYFALKLQPSKRAYKFGSKEISLHGGFERDLVSFALLQLGMSRVTVEGYMSKKPGKLAHRVRGYLNRVNDTGELSLQVVKSTTTDSGYKVVGQPTKVRSNPSSFLSQLTKGERAAYELMKSNRLYPNVARSILLTERRIFGSNAPDYIKFVIHEFQQWVREGKMIIKDKAAEPAILSLWFTDRYRHDIYKDFLSRTRKKRSEINSGSSTLNLLLPKAPASKIPIPQSSRPPAVYSIESFQRSRPELYKRILVAVQVLFKEFRKQHQKEGADIPQKVLDSQIANRVDACCRKAHEEFRKGNEDYIPDILLEEK